MFASMLWQTSLLQCCHFSSLPSASCVLGQSILHSSLPSSPPTPDSLVTIPFFLSGILNSTAMHPSAPTQWPRMSSTLHLTLGNLLTTDFCFSFPLLFSSCFVDLSCLFLFSFSNSPSFSVWVLFCFISFPVKWPYQVPRYVSDAAPHVPTLRFGKEMSTKSLLQGRPSSSSTFFPVLDNLFFHWRELKPVSVLCNVPLFLLFVFASTLIFLV